MTPGMRPVATLPAVRRLQAADDPHRHVLTGLTVAASVLMAMAGNAVLIFAE